MKRLKQQTNRSAGRTKKKKRRSAGHYRLKAFAGTAAVMVVALAGVWAVNAYLSAQTGVTTNNFTPQKFTYTDIGIKETIDDEATKYTLSVNGTTGTLKSGDNDKYAQISVTAGEDKKPVFIRATLVMNIYDSNGANITAECTEKEITPAYTIGSKWSSKTRADGLTYYYYNEIVVPGKTTEELFTAVSIANADQLPDNSHVEIDVIADAVQAVSDDGQSWNASHYTTDEIYTAWGLRPTMKNGDKVIPNDYETAELVDLGKLEGVTLTW